MTPLLARLSRALDTPPGKAFVIVLLGLNALAAWWLAIPDALRLVANWLA